MIVLTESMTAYFQTINAVCDPSAVSRLSPLSYCALLSGKVYCKLYNVTLCPYIPQLTDTLIMSSDGHAQEFT